MAAKPSHTEDTESAVRPSQTDGRRRNGALFVLVFAIWLALDLVTKALFNNGAAGRLIAGPFAGIFELRLIHNTGGAWGIFDDSTLALAVLSLAVCVVLGVCFIIRRKKATVGETLGLALVCAGGLGNGIDRLALGYVVDFIEPVFIDFPVFNVADIGVTCGFVLLFIALARDGHRKDALQSGERIHRGEGGRNRGSNA